MAAINITPPQLSENDILRFHASVSRLPGQGPKGDCWEWQKSKSKRKTGFAYGKFKAHRRDLSTHKIAFYLATGRWPDTFLVCHSCDNPPCCNPDHLGEGTPQTNSDDKINRGRQPRPFLELHPERAKRGEAHHKAKVTNEQVLRIRAMAADGCSSTVIRQTIPLSKSMVCGIVNRKFWKHI